MADIVAKKLTTFLSGYRGRGSDSGSVQGSTKVFKA